VLNRYNRFNARFEQQSLFVPYVEVRNFGDILIILMDGENPICYIKENILNFMDPNPELKWFQFIPDRTVGKVKHHYNAGMISMKLSIWDVTANGSIDFRKEKAWKKDPHRRAIPVTIRAYIYQCKDLPAADGTGDSDPYVQAWDISDQTNKKT